MAPPRAIAKATVNMRKPDARTALRLREAKKIEILILLNGQGANNLPAEEKYKKYPIGMRLSMTENAKSMTLQSSHNLRDKLERLKIGKVGVLDQDQYSSLPSLPELVDILFGKEGTRFVIQLKQTLSLDREQANVLFMNPTCEPRELQEYCNIPFRELEEFIRQQNAMCLLHSKLCVPPPQIKKTGEKLNNFETDFMEGEVDRYMEYQTRVPARVERFEGIVADNNNKGLIFVEDSKFNGPQITAKLSSETNKKKKNDENGNQPKKWTDNGWSPVSDTSEPCSPKELRKLSIMTTKKKESDENGNQLIEVADSDRSSSEGWSPISDEPCSPLFPRKSYGAENINVDKFGKVFAGNISPFVCSSPEDI